MQIQSAIPGMLQYMKHYGKMHAQTRMSAIMSAGRTFKFCTNEKQVRHQMA